MSRNTTRAKRASSIKTLRRNRSGCPRSVQNPSGSRPIAWTFPSITGALRARNFKCSRPFARACRWPRPSKPDFWTRARRKPSARIRCASGSPTGLNWVGSARPTLKHSCNLRTRTHHRKVRNSGVVVSTVLGAPSLPRICSCGEGGIPRYSVCPVLRMPTQEGIPGMIDLIRGAYARACSLLDSLQSPLLLAIRVYWGWQFAQDGWGKLTHLDRVTQFFTTLGLPAPGMTAFAVALVEFAGGILFALGIASRLVSLVLFVNMTMAYLSVPDDRMNFAHIFSKPEDFYGAGPYTYWFAALLILVFGPGRFALDSLINRRQAPAIEE